MGSTVRASGTKPESVEDSDDISQDGDDSGERETVVMGIEEGETRPSSLRVSQSVYLCMTNISAHSGPKLRGDTWRRGSYVRRSKTLLRFILDRKPGYSTLSLQRRD